MNTTKIYITNIISDNEKSDGHHNIVCDINDLGHHRYNVELNCSPIQYGSIKAKGFIFRKLCPLSIYQ